MSRTVKKKKRSKKKWLFLIILLAVAAGGGYYYRKYNRTLNSNRNEEPFPNLAVVEAVEGSISIITKGSGSIEAAFKKAVSMEYEGKLESIYVEPGDQVHIGDELALYDRQALDTVIKAKETELTNINQSISQAAQFGNYYVSSPVSGYIKKIFASSGDSAEEVIRKYGGLVEISADNKLKIEFTAEGYVPEQGKPVLVTFDYDTVTGVVESSVGREICVTIPDNYYYQVGTPAIVYTGSWERLGSGVLQSNQPYLVQAENGIINYSYVNTYTMVYTGTPLFCYSGAVYSSTYIDLLKDREEHTNEIQELKEYQQNPVVISKYDGYIVSVEAMEGMNYKKDQQLCTIADSSSLNLKVDIDELDIDGVNTGDRAKVVFDAFADEVYEGYVKKVSGVGKNAGGVTTYTVTIELSGDTRIKDAMSATAEILVKERERAVLVPTDAVFVEGDKKYVQVVQGTELIKTEVHIGLINEDYTEILDGISAGTAVAFNKAGEALYESSSHTFFERTEE